MTDSALSTQHSALVPDFVVCGNVVRDIVPGGWAPGGTAVYAAVVARGLGRRVGVVTIDGTQPAPIVLAQADIAMYAAKERGRNQVAVYCPPVRTSDQ